MNTLILSTKVFLISAGVLSLAMGIKFSVPLAVNGIPELWSVISLWLKPPYLYIIINGIIITIAATSRFHHGKSELSDHHSISVKPSSFPTPPPSEPTIMLYESRVEEEEEDMVVELKPVIVNGAKVNLSSHHDEEEIIVAESEGGDVFIEYSYGNDDDYESATTVEANDLISPELESLFPVREKPLISTRFGHRKPTRTTPEVSGVRRLRVARPKKHDTLESTWKAITEGRHVPLTRHMKKSETMEQAPDHVLKSETFNDRTSFESRSIAKIRKEPSLGQEELNRRVEAFIKKFNDDMRMQRQESLNQYMEMINRGV